MEGESGMRRWVVVVLAVVAAAVLVTIVYQAGVSHGIALQPPAAVAPYYGPWRGGFFGPLLGIFLFLFVLRTVFWGMCGWGWRRRWRYYDYPDYGPSQFDDWHRRAHDRMRDDRAPAAPTNV